VKRDPRFAKEAIERRIFDALVPLLGWAVVPGSVEQSRPPRPDILCEVSGAGAVAVELVALDIAATRQRMSNMFSTSDAWRSALAERPIGEQRALQSDLRNAYISVSFAEQAGPRDRAAALYKLQSFLLIHRRRRGEVQADEIDSPRGFHSASIWRGGISKGPQVTSSSAGYWHQPQVSNITKHLQTCYEVTAPLDLFAYSLHDEPDGATNSLANIQAVVAQHLPGSRFRRVHVFHVGFLKHIWSSC
jgi:hypothetical protein